MNNLCLACVAFVCLSLGAGAALGESPFKANASIRDSLNALFQAKKGVVVVLKNGETYRAVSCPSCSSWSSYSPMEQWFRRMEHQANSR